MTQLTLILLALLTVTWLINRFAGLHRNISLLFLAQPMISAMAPMMVFIGGIISQPMATDPSWVTLPLTLMIAGTAVGTVPSALLARRLGRRRATMVGFSASVLGGLIGAWAVHQQSFVLFVVAAFILGISGAFAIQLRFAAIESLDDTHDIPKAISLLMLTGIFAALIGPELAYVSQHWLTSSPAYTGTFLGTAAFGLLAILAVAGFKSPPLVETPTTEPNRPLVVIMRQPVFIVAITAAALGFGLMSFVMTATPLSMHQLHHHSLADTKWVIQSHVTAMYLPSLITIWLGQRVQTKYFLLVGTLMFIGVVIIASQGHELLHYWWALILLGIGWNFLFYAGTTLLPLSYRPEERHKIQAINDLTVCSFQGASSLMAGWVVYHYQWSGILLTCIPFLLIMLAITVLRFVTTRQHTTTSAA
ncbi:MFS transporter [Marinicella meishanensis]|uniref:MFS transporter n=1 Tax=Marinicella meishanensis TaxID=2873263 RepID=UPI001CC10BC8|nr:MFS transporter [Marinicella sp. NBU2979]